MAWASAAKNLPAWAEMEVDLPSLRGRESSAEEAAVQSSSSSFSPFRERAEAVPRTAPPSLSDLFVVQPLPVEQSTSSEPVAASTSEKAVVFIVKSQIADQFANMGCSQVTIQINVVQHSSSPDSQTGNITLRVEVPDYDVKRNGHFRQIQVCASGRGILLVAPRCCAGVVVPALDDPDVAKEATVRAVPLVPPEGVELIKVLWHPLSDAHIGMLLSNGTWQLLNIAHCVALADPEVSIKVAFGGECEEGEQCSDFSFGLPSALASQAASRSDAVWLAVAVFFLSSRGRISICSPILPSLSVFPAAMLESLRTPSEGVLDSYEWLSRTLLCTANRRSVPWLGAPPGTYRSVRHNLHLHGDSETYFRRWTPLEQTVSEARTENETSPRSPRSPRHQRGRYCSIQLVSHFPVAVVARATTSGLVELLVLSGAITPEFDRRGGHSNAKTQSLSCVVFEEVDLCTNPTKAPVVQLSVAPSAESGSTATLLARSRTLIAAIELPWLASLCASSVEVLPSAAVTTLMEIRTADGPCEIVGWQIVPTTASGRRNDCIGLGLRIREGDAQATDSDRGRGSLQIVDVRAVSESAAKVRASKETPTSAVGRSSSPAVPFSHAPGADSEREEYLRYLSQPLRDTSNLFGTARGDVAELPTAGGVAKWVACVQGGQVAALSAKQEVLKDLAAQAPERVKNVTTDIAELREKGEQIRRRTEATKRHVETICERQAKLDEKYRSLTEALSSHLELYALNATAAEELPRLWSQVHELRQAFELLRAAAAPQNPHELAARSADWLSKVESLQQTWTHTTTDSLRVQAAEAEKLIAKAAAQLRCEGTLAVAG